MVRGRALFLKVRGAEIKLLLVSPGGASMVRTTAKNFIF